MSGLHALVIEDELLAALGLQTMLGDLGFGSFAYAATEMQAVEQARLRCPDLVTVDVGLLDGSGVGALEAILGACGPLPVVYVTGAGAALKGRTAEAIVDKPVSLGALKAAVEAARAKPLEPARPAAEASADGRSAVI